MQNKIELKLDKLGNGEFFISRNRKLTILGSRILNEFEYCWSMSRLRFDWWLDKTGFFESYNNLKKIVLENYKIRIKK